MRQALSGWWRPGCRIGVAVSGGSDSVALLRLLLAVVPQPRHHLMVLHIDHGHRPDTDAARRWVEALAARWNVEFAYLSLSLPDPGSKQHYPDRDAAPAISPARHPIGFEAWARERRLEAFATWTRLHRLSAVAVGHTADDQAETLLLRLLRGAAPFGMVGMRTRRRFRTWSGPVVVWRPLLGLTRSRLREWLRAKHQDWLEDPTNRDPAHLRNRIRHELLPTLTELRPGFTGRLLGLAADWRRHAALVARAVRRWQRRLATRSRFALTPRPPPELLPELLANWWRHLEPDEAEGTAMPAAGKSAPLVGQADSVCPVSPTVPGLPATSASPEPATMPALPVPPQPPTNPDIATTSQAPAPPAEPSPTRGDCAPLPPRWRPETPGSRSATGPSGSAAATPATVPDPLSPTPDSDRGPAVLRTDRDNGIIGERPPPSPTGAAQLHPTRADLGPFKRRDPSRTIVAALLDLAGSRRGGRAFVAAGLVIRRVGAALVATRATAGQLAGNIRPRRRGMRPSAGARGEGDDPARS